MYKDGMTISEVLGTTIAEKGITQAEAATALGVQQPTINRWVLGRATPGDDAVPALIKFTGLKKAQVLDAVHAQRLDRTGLANRVGALEAAVKQIQSDQREVLELLRELRPTRD